MRFEAAPDLRRLDDGRVALGGSPLRFLRLSEKGAALVDRLCRGDDLSRSGEVAFARRLVDKGMVVPRPALGAGAFGPDDVTVIVPVRDRADELDACLRAIRKSDPPAEVIVVDDGSHDATSIERVADTHRARLVQLDRNHGPAGARNRGLAEVITPLVAFVDSDVEVGDDWLSWLARFFADEEMGLVAPRVTTPPVRPGASAWARYDAARSPLDLGPRPGPVHAGSRVAYVPAAAILCRTEAVRSLGGFDDLLRVGEDVDLVWRMTEAGWRSWYAGDEGWVTHPVRPDLGAALRQRIAYGSSAAPLDLRHPGAVAPLAVSGWSAGVWAAAAAGQPLVGLAVAASNVVAMSRKVRFLDHPGVESARLVGRGHLGAGELLGRALVRPWFPFTVAAALTSRRARRVALAAAVVPPLLEWARRRPPLDPVRWTACSLADDVSYSVGVWSGCVRARSFRSLRPSFSN
jgi:mycofactocin system glycosyltransferase